MEPNGNRNGRIWHDFGLLLERMYKVARTGHYFDSSENRDQRIVC